MNPLARAIIAAAGAPSAPSLTLPMTDLYAGYEARTGVTESPAGFVTQWNDLGPNGYHLTQPGADSIKPLVTTVSGFPALNFTDNRFLRNISVAAGSGIRTIYVVWSVTPVQWPNWRTLRGAIAAGTQHVSLRPGGVQWTNTYALYDGGERFTTATVTTDTLQRVTWQIPTTTTLTITATGGLNETVVKGNYGFGTEPSMSLGTAGTIYYSLYAEVVAYYEYTAAHNPDVEAYIFQEFGV